MQPKYLYLLLTILGAALPLSQFLPWLAENGLDLPRFVHELFTNRISSFFALDVIISAVVVVTFAALECARTGLRLWWIPILATLTVGVSCGLPLLLYLRETRRQTASVD